MRTGTVVSLGASAVLGIGALVVARLWLPQSAHPPQTKALPEMTSGTVPVVVASGPIAFGTKLDASKLAVVRLPSSAVPPGAFSTPAQLLSQPGGAPVALISIAPHEPLLPAKLSGPGARPIVSAGITEGMHAYTIGVTETAGVGGHVLPGDRVDVIVSRDVPPPTVKAKDGSETDSNVKRVRADVVLQDIKVLGMDLNVDPTTTTSVISHTATLEVSVQDAEKLAVATQAGTMSLALRRLGQADVAPTRTVEIADLQSSGPRAPGGVSDRPRLIAVSRHRSAPAFPAQIEIRTRSVVVVHGDAATSVQVPAERYGAGA
jgi:pilus assembly protein CpaB